MTGDGGNVINISRGRSVPDPSDYELDGYAAGFVDGLARRRVERDRYASADDTVALYSARDVVVAFELGRRVQRETTIVGDIDAEVIELTTRLTRKVKDGTVGVDQLEAIDPPGPSRRRRPRPGRGRLRALPGGAS